MESKIAGALKISAGLSATGVVCGFASWAWLPEHMDFFGVGEVPKLVGILLVPVIGIVLTLMVALIVSCDPLLATQDLSSRVAVAAMIAVPSFFSLPIQIILLWATWSDHKVGTTPFTVLASILLIILGFVFNYIEQNHVVGIRDLWTLQSAHVWEETHALASKMFAVTGVVGIVLAFFVPGGFWQEMLIIALFLIPSIAAVIYSFIIREDAQYQYILWVQELTSLGKVKALDTVLTPSKVKDYLIDVCKDIKIFKQGMKLLHIWALASINFQNTISGEPSTL